MRPHTFDVTVSALAALASAFAGLARAAERPLTPREIIARAEPSVVQVVATDAHGREVSMGSGFVADAKGLVVTNLHVTANAAAAHVRFRDGAKCPVAGYRARDREGDLAVLEVGRPPPKIAALPLAPDAPPPAQGDPVTAIGHPKGFDFTVTVGIVSAVRRTSELPEPVRRALAAPADQLWVQTSAAVNEGNSGGPLLDEFGRVVGVNTFVADGQGLGFAVHVSRVRRALAEAARSRATPLDKVEFAADPKAPFATLAPKVAPVMEEYQLALAHFQRMMALARDPRELKRVVEQQHPGPKYAARLWAVADADRRTHSAFQALCLAASIDADGANAAPAAVLPKALGRLAEDHASDAALFAALPMLFEEVQPCPPLAEFLRASIAKGRDERVRGLCSLKLIHVLMAFDAARPDRPPAHREEQMRLLAACAGEFKDVELGDGDEGEGKVTIGTVAGHLDVWLRHLTVGGTAMEIEGKDAAGRAMRLGEQRGKAVMLDFFADWCPHCVAMYPHERELSKRYAGRPFALLGVNCDSPDTLRQLVREGKVTWRCWADGRAGPVAAKWRVDAYPRVYLIDHQGTIVRIFNGRPREAELDAAIEKLVKAAEAAAAGGPATRPAARPAAPRQP